MSNTTTTKQTVIPLWRYHCPECGFSDAEMGYHATTDAIYCEVCLEEERYIRVKRWPVEGD